MKTKKKSEHRFLKALGGAACFTVGGLTLAGGAMIGNTKAMLIGGGVMTTSGILLKQAVFGRKRVDEPRLKTKDATGPGKEPDEIL